MIFKRENYPKETVMHCKTKEEAEIFTDYLEKQGLKWCTGEEYSERGTEYDKNEDQTCYNYNSGSYARVDFYLLEGYLVLEFEDFDWDGHPSAINTDTSVIDKFLKMFRKGSENK